MSSVSEKSRVLPYAGTKIAIYLTKQIETLKGEVSQREIATALGYDRPNIISMFKTGDAKVPLDKIPDLAAALHVDPAHLMRLGLEQYWPDKMGIIGQVFGGIVTANERVIIEIIRETSGNMDPKPTEEQKMLLRRMFRKGK